MHQQPPQTPLCRSTSSAKPGHEASFKGVTSNLVTTHPLDPEDVRERTAAPILRRATTIPVASAVVASTVVRV
jgi:hypothetical protein